MMDMGGEKKMEMMEMYFHFRIPEYILFYQWKPENVLAYVFSCVGVFAIAFAYEAIKFMRTKLDSDQAAHDCCDAEIRLSDAMDGNYTQLPFTPALMTRGQHVASCIIYFVQTFGAYCLMMIAMTYNYPIVLSMLMGHVVAFFFIGPLYTISPQESGDCCG